MNKELGIRNYGKFKFVLLALMFVTLLFYILNRSFISNSLNINSLSSSSVFIENKTTVFYSLYKPKGYLYKSSKEGLDGVMGFLIKNPSYSNGKKILPSNFINNTKLIRQSKDKDDLFLQKRGISLTNEHYFFDQRIQGIQVYASRLSVHLKNKNEIYSIDGNLVTDQNIGVQKITEEQAKQIALNTAYKDASEESKLKVAEFKKYIINKKILGYDENNKNYLTLEIRVDSDSEFKTFSTSYFVNLENGEIIYESPKILNGLNREIYRCAGGSCSGIPPSRSEGGAPTGDSDADRAYDFFGEIYNFYAGNFQRDSYDARGATLKGYVHARIGCPNAAWTGQEMLFCDNMVTKDIAAHELTHAVTNLTANLEYNYQSGALNESISDIFGYAVDNDDWGMGEGSVLGIIRYLDDPPKKGQPDRLFASNYHCDSSDNGGVHRNSGVMNKAFYLMVTGGNFNGCSINGVGQQRAEAIVYYALVNKLSPTSNFKAMYNALTESCDQLYSSDQGICDNVKAAIQSTEMDQQPASQQTGIRCRGGQVTPPQCAGNIAPTNPSDRPPPTNPVPTDIPPTDAPLSYQISGKVYKTTGEAVIGAKLLLSGYTSRDTVTDASGNYSFDNLESNEGFELQPYFVTLEIIINNTSTQKPSEPIILTSNSRRRIVNFEIENNVIKPPIIITPTPIPTRVPTSRPTLTGSRPTITPTHGVTPTGTSPTLPPIGGGNPSPTKRPTPTPIPYTCIPDEGCIKKSGQSNIQLCPLKCTPL